MASSPAPATPTTTPQRATTINRSFTVPIKAPSTSSAATTDGKENIETLYMHPSASIIKFITKPSPSTPFGALPWTTPTERTIASGQIEVYRVPGICSYLRSGTLLQPVMPKSQCWCVDGAGKFVFRARELDTYYRVELPCASEEGRGEMERFRGVLRKISAFEKAECPFWRKVELGFSREDDHVDHVEAVPAEEEQLESRPKRRRSSGPKAKRWKLDRAYGWKPEGWEPGMDVPDDEDSGSASHSGSQAGSEDESGQEEVDELVERVNDVNVGPSARDRAMQALRSASMPQSAMSHSTSPLKRRTQAGEDGTFELDQDDDDDEEPSEEGSRSTEVPTLRSFQAIPTDMPPSPPDSSAGLEYLERRAHPEQLVDAVRSTGNDETVTGADSLDGDNDGREDSTLHANAELESSIVHQHGEEMESTTEVSVPPVDAPREDVDHAPTTVEAEDEIPQPTDITVEPQTRRSTLPIELEPDPPPSRTNRPHQEVPTSGQPSPDIRPETPLSQTPSTSSAGEDPYAAIQARILARRSLSGTTSFHPLHKSPTRSSTSSTSSSSATIVSRRPNQAQQDAAYSTRLIKQFLGPPAELVKVMLRIAAKFAGPALGVLHVESPRGERGRVPGRFAEGIGEVDLENEMDEEGWEDDEDDFGVPVRRAPSDLRENGSGRAGRGDVD